MARGPRASMVHKLSPEVQSYPCRWDSPYAWELHQSVLEAGWSWGIWENHPFLLNLLGTSATRQLENTEAQAPWIRGRQPNNAIVLENSTWIINCEAIGLIWAPIGIYRRPQMTWWFVSPYGFFHGCRHCFMSSDTLVHFAWAPRSSTAERSKESSLAKIRNSFDSLLQVRYAARLGKYPH